MQSPHNGLTTNNRPFAVPKSRITGSQINRRTAGMILSASLLGGCGPNRTTPETEKGSSTSADSPPLQVLLWGNEAESEAIQLAWSMTMEQPLQIKLFSADASSNSGIRPEDGDIAKGASLAEQIDQAMRFADVAILPQKWTGTIAANGAAVPLAKDLFAEFDQQMGTLYPAVVDGLGGYSGQQWGIGVGANVLSVLALDSDVSLNSWADYHTWVASLGGRSAEPLAAGWAVCSFLNRCSTSFARGWLFDRMSMNAEIGSEDYVSVLEQMIATAKLYADADVSPGEIWNRLRRGQLKGGIAFQSPEQEPSQSQADSGNADAELFDISVFSCPVETQVERVWFPQETLIAFLSAGCRQSDASKRFIGWLTGGERINAVREQVSGFTRVRDRKLNQTVNSGAAYDQWLAGHLQNRQVAPGLILPQADLYYSALDQQVRRALSGECSAHEALSEAADEWNTITDRAGRERQTIAWKRVLGFGA